MKVAVTGGTGCLGRPLVQRLLDEGLDVNLLIHEKEINHWQNKLTYIQGDINSTIALETLTRNCDIVFHLAGKVNSISKSIRDEEEIYKINQVGTENLLRAVRLNGIKRVIFFSTVGVYGKDSNFHGSETSPCNPITAYQKSKYSAEKLVLKSQINNGPDGVVLRFPVVYGKFDRGNVASLIKAIYRKHFSYYGNETIKRSMISSGNAAEAALKAAFESSVANQVFNVTDGRDYELRELVDSIRKALRTDWHPKNLPHWLIKLGGKMGDYSEKLLKKSMPVTTGKIDKLSGSLTFSCDKAKQLFKYHPIFSMDESIFEEVEWLKTQNDWK